MLSQATGLSMPSSWLSSPCIQLSWLSSTTGAYPSERYICMSNACNGSYTSVLCSFQNQKLEIRFVRAPTGQQGYLQVAVQREQKTLRELNAMDTYDFAVGDSALISFLVFCPLSVCCFTWSYWLHICSCRKMGIAALSLLDGFSPVSPGGSLPALDAANLVSQMALDIDATPVQLLHSNSSMCLVPMYTPFIVCLLFCYRS